MKKRTHSILCGICMLLLLSMLFSCTSPATNPSESTNAGESTSDSENTTEEESESSTEPGETEPTESEPEESTTEGGNSAEEPQQYPTGDTPKSLKILAIGNSFSVDTMQYLYSIAKSAGVETIVLGNLYIGGCSLETHLTHAKADDGAYTYYKNNSGNWSSSTKVKFSTGLKDEEWDYITLQQTSKTSGLVSSYGKTLTDLIAIVEEGKTNANAKLLWHMTWAYQQDSTHSSFPNYDRSQSKMYAMIVDAVKTCILPVENFAGVIPTGTAIQNARTSFTGDTLTRDGYHLNYTLGRYIGALSWYAAITGDDIADIAYFPSSDITAEVMAMAKEAVINSMKYPYQVTNSTYTSGTWEKDPAANSTTIVLPEDCYEADKALATSLGINLDDYVLLIYDYLENQYYYSTKGSGTTKPSSSGSTYQQNICTAKIFTKAEIPENSIIICDSGWQYRPELWVSLTVKATTRPSMVTDNIKLLDKNFWGSNQYFAFNIAASPKTNISAYYAAAASHVRVYIPKSALETTSQGS